MNMENKRNKFIILNRNKEEVECEVLFTFESEETKKNYIVYTDNTKDSNGNIRVFASIYNPDSEDRALLPIESDKEWNVVEAILNSIQEENKTK